MTTKRANKMLKLLRKELDLPNWRGRTKSPFETLAVTMISQNTNSRNSAKPVENLSKKFGITSEALSKANVE